jgi:hypothetical protein
VGAAGGTGVGEPPWDDGGVGSRDPSRQRLPTTLFGNPVGAAAASGASVGSLLGTVAAQASEIPSGQHLPAARARGSPLGAVVARPLESPRGGGGAAVREAVAARAFGRLWRRRQAEEKRMRASARIGFSDFISRDVGPTAQASSFFRVSRAPGRFVSVGLAVRSPGCVPDGFQWFLWV